MRAPIYNYTVSSNTLVLAEQKQYFYLLNRMSLTCDAVIISSYGIGLGGMILQKLENMSRYTKLKLLIGLPPQRYSDGFVTKAEVKAAMKERNVVATTRFLEACHAKYAIGMVGKTPVIGIISNWNLHMSNSKQVAIVTHDDSSLHELLEVHRSFWKEAKR